MQETGKTTRERWHKANWDEIEADPKKLELPREGWILHHDAEGHAEKMCEQIFGPRKEKKRGESKI